MTAVAGKQRRLMARALSRAADASVAEVLASARGSMGICRRIGVTGPPGAGKSSLIAALARHRLGHDGNVAILAVDPTSPVSGGAILGDRIRMSRHATDDGVFIRSLATRGHLGGLTRSARDVVRVLDACGYDLVIVETVGVGQDELEITHTAHSTLVVMAPGMGDEVQAIKAGILECADVFAVNKADREGADAAVRDLELMVSLGNESIRALSKVRGHATHGHADGFVQGQQAGASADDLWTPPILKCVAARGEGVADLVTALDRHRAWVEGTEKGRARRRARLAEQLRESLRESLIEAAVHDLGPRIDEAVQAVDSRTVDPYTATERLVAAFRSR